MGRRRLWTRIEDWWLGENDFGRMCWIFIALVIPALLFLVVVAQ